MGCVLIYFFGDSHTKGMGNQIADDYTHIPYSVRLAKLLNTDYVMLAELGLSLNESVDTLIKNLNKIQKDDLVIFQFQTLLNCRYRFDNSGEKFNWKEMDEVKNISLEDKNLILDFYTKFSSCISKEEVDKVYFLFDYLKSKGVRCKTLYWCDMDYYVDSEYNISIDDVKYIENYCKDNVSTVPLSIKDEVGYDDNHLSNPMNEIIAEQIYKKVL